MNELIQKVSSYNLFNYLFPGIMTTVFIESITSYKFLHENMIINAFIVYFIGLIVSRIGSICVEPLLKFIVKHEDYNDYIDASKKDDKISIFSEQNNMYRTLISMIIIIFMAILVDKYASEYQLNLPVITLCLLLLLFIVSYVKQTKYITKRVKRYKEKR